MYYFRQLSNIETTALEENPCPVTDHTTSHDEETKFPDFFPEGCPPEDASPAEGIFFRAVPDKPNRTLKIKHLQSQRESQPTRDFGDVSECALCSISLLRDKVEAVKYGERLIASIPAFREYIPNVAVGTLTPEHGRIKHTPNNEVELKSHHDWWKHASVNGLDIFVHVEEAVNA